MIISQERDGVAIGGGHRGTEEEGASVRCSRSLVDVSFGRSWQQPGAGVVRLRRPESHFGFCGSLSTATGNT